MLKHQVHPEVIKFFKNNSVCITTDKDYFFFPAWISHYKDDLIEVHHLGKLPEQLVSAINGFREKGFEGMKPINMEDTCTS